MSMTEIERTLKMLRLPGMRVALEARALQSTQGELTFIDAFSALLQDEIDSRRSRRIEQQYQRSGLKERKTMSAFDWSFNPKLPKNACFELVTLKFIQNGEDAIIIGAPGTGKSYIAQVVAHAAIQAGYRVAYREAHKLFQEVFEATQLGRRKKALKIFSDADLFVTDDLFLRKKLPHDAADDLQEIIMDRYTARKSTFVTSNRIIEDWGQCLGDNAVASAILDRLLHHGHLLKFEGKSYRLKEASFRLAKERRNN
ncbi:MAG: IS21-like element helper ATPase IstB [Desulfobacterales bacterium]|nr:IS21-like element helper ATPase IstB [Desulfobacterales bacterium]